MRKKVMIEYEPDTGNIYDKNGLMVMSYHNLQHFDEEPTPVSSITKLAEAGMTAEDIVTLKKGGVL